jgi:5-methylcytosine-specific restriction protein A
MAPAPEEIVESTGLSEGALRTITVNAYERNPEARRLCIEHYGAICSICGFKFGAVYGEAFEDFIHVHHLRPLSEIGLQYVVDPIKDLRPVCPNCHAVLHRRADPPYKIEEVRAFLRSKVVN